MRGLDRAPRPDPSWIVPDRGGHNPATVSASVVLPQPFGPVTPSQVAASSSNDTPLTAGPATPGGAPASSRTASRNAPRVGVMSAAAVSAAAPRRDRGLRHLAIALAARLRGRAHRFELRHRAI